MASGRTFLSSVIFSFLVLNSSFYDFNTRVFLKKRYSDEFYSVSGSNESYIWEYKGCFYTDNIRLLRARHVGTQQYYRKSFCRSRLQYYCNSTATFQLDKILVSGDVQLNPGPVKNPCTICQKAVAKTHRSMNCEGCGFKTHIKCANVSPAEYVNFQTLRDYTWFCTGCTEYDLSLNDSYTRNDAGSFTGENYLKDLADKLQNCTSKDIKVAHLNVRSLRNKIDEIRCLQVLCRFEILAITESHLDNSITDSQLTIDGMKFVRLDRIARKGGGCILYYAEHLKAVHRRDLHTPGIEAIWLQIKFPTTSALFSVMYRPPNDNAFFNTLSTTLERAWLKSTDIFLLGDLNCDYNDSSNSAYGTKLQSIFDAFNMQNIITVPTRTTIESSTLIDLIVTTRRDLVSSTGVFPLGISDHDLIYASLRLRHKRPPPRLIKIRNYKNFDEKSFKSDLVNAPFHVTECFEDMDDILWAWQSLFNTICDNHAPWKEVKIKSQAPPWITSDIRLKMNRRFKLFKLAVSSKCPIKWSEYKKVRNDVTRSIRQAKTSYFTDLFSKVKNTGAYWNLVNKSTNPKSRKSIGPIKKEDKTLALTDKEKANSINLFFSTVGHKLNSLLPTSTHLQPPTLVNNEVPLLSQVALNREAVSKKINSLQVKKSAGPDNIHPKLLRLAGDAITTSLIGLYQYSIDREEVFSQWKLARISPIHKKDDETDIANYRPVSLLSIPSKILESLVNDALVDHVFTSNDLASDRQWAYRKGYSTELLITHLTELWRRELDKGKAIAVAFIDFKKAFDCVQHSLLISKLQRNFGISGPLLNWLNSYLNNRQQYTVVNGAESDTMLVQVGVPQGSVLGPTLFTLFTNDLPFSVVSGETYMYADDTTVYCVGNNGDEAVLLLNRALSELYEWCLINRLTPHPKKCEAMLMTRSNFIGPIPSVSIGGSLITWVERSRLLGVTVDNKLTWSPHLLEVKKSFANKLNLLKKSRFLPRSVLEKFYLCVILPSVTYCLLT